MLLKDICKNTPPPPPPPPPPPAAQAVISFHEVIYKLSKSNISKLKLETHINPGPVMAGN